MAQIAGFRKKFIISGFAFFMVFTMLFLLTGCGDDDTNEIEICNYDDEEYQVKLHRDSDDTVIQEFELDEFYDLPDMCESFKNLPADRYYISIHENNSEIATDQSDSFYLNEDDTRYYWIDSTGGLNRQ